MTDPLDINDGESEMPPRPIRRPINSDELLHAKERLGEIEAVLKWASENAWSVCRWTMAKQWTVTIRGGDEFIEPDLYDALKKARDAWLKGQP